MNDQIRNQAVHSPTSLEIWLLAGPYTLAARCLSYHESHPTVKVIAGRLLPTLGRKSECKVEALSFLKIFFGYKSQSCAESH